MYSPFSVRYGAIEMTANSSSSRSSSSSSSSSSKGAWGFH